MTDNLTLAVNEALADYQNILSQNFRNVVAGAGPGSDTKRPFAWREYGWPTDPTAEDFYALYDRQGVAYGVTHLLTDKCWETDPWVIEGSEDDNKSPTTGWEKAARLFFKRSRFWESYREADSMRLVSGWSALILQLADGKKFSDPVTGTPRLVKCIPAWRTQLVPNDPIVDETNPQYGEPSNWTFKESGVTNPRNLTIHPDRIVILGDWRNGRSALRSCYNDFVNLEKITGGSGESFLKNAARQIAVSYDKDVNLSDIARSHGVGLDKLKEQFDLQARKLNRGIDSMIVTQGGTANALVATVPDPTPHYSVSMQNIAAAWRVPLKSIVGMQTGERASTEDANALAARAQGRRTNELSADAEQAVNHLIRIKLLAPMALEFTIMWDNLNEPTKAERLALADSMATTNQKNAGQGEGPVWGVNEMREVAGYEALTDPLPLPDVEPEDDELDEVETDAP